MSLSDRLPEYDFKRLPELGWAIFAAVSIEVLQIVVATDLAVVEDWKAWAITLGFAALAAGARAGLAWFGRRGRFS